MRLTGSEALKGLAVGDRVHVWDPTDPYPSSLLPIEVEVARFEPACIVVVTATGRPLRTWPFLGYRYEHVR